MQREEAKTILIYYRGIPDMLKVFRRQKEEIEDTYYNSVRGIDMDGMPHGSNPGRPTESMAILAADNEASARLREIETKIMVLEQDERHIRGAIDALNGRYKKLLSLRFINDYSWTKTAYKMRASERTARYWSDKALDRLIFALEDVPMLDEILERASRARI